MDVFFFLFSTIFSIIQLIFHLSTILLDNIVYVFPMQKLVLKIRDYVIPVAINDAKN
jgi:hypothetical protein